MRRRIRVQFRPKIATTLLILATAGIYLSLVGAPPLNWDDDSNIFANPFYRAGIWIEFWRHAYFGLFVPITSTVWQVLFTLGDGGALPFRIFNAALHAANTWLVYALLARRTGRAPAWFGAALFALHPMQTAAVAWISGGRDLLAASFALLCLVAAERARRWTALLSFGLACLSKPNVVTLPAAIGPWARGRVRDYAPWLAAALVAAAFVTWRTIAAQAEHLVAPAWWQRPWLMGDTYWFYLSHLTGLVAPAVNYARTPAAVLARPATLATAAIPWAILIYGFVRRPWWGRWVGSAALLLLPVSGIVPFGFQRVSGVADHYAYLALAAIAGMLADGLARFGQGKWLKSAAVVWLAGFSTLTISRLSVWRSNENFFADMARAAPDAYATAIGMSSVACADRGDFTEGVRWTEVALRAKPLDVRALANQAFCLLHAGQNQAVLALDANLDRMDLDAVARAETGAYASLLASIGSALVAEARFDDGYAYLCEALRLMPAEPIHRHNLDVAADLLRRRGLSPKCEDDPGT